MSEELKEAELTAEEVTASTEAKEAELTAEEALKDFMVSFNGGISIPVKGISEKDAKAKFIEDVKANPSKYTEEIVVIVNENRPFGLRSI